MDDEADHAREYERLRAELADFVLGALGERVASGEQPQLSQVLADAIDRRVDEAVAARIGKIKWPDPDEFADRVIAAIDARGVVDGERPRARNADEAPTRRTAPLKVGTYSRLQLILLAVIGVVIVAAIAYFILNRTVPQTTSETRNGVVFNREMPAEPTPDGGSNVILPPPANGAGAGAGRNETRPR